MNALLQQAAQHAADQVTVQEYVSRIIPAGKTMARFIGYVELGKRKDSYLGKEKAPTLKARLIFELNSKQHLIAATDDTPAHYTQYAFDVSVKTGEKAGFRKLFMKMRGGDENIKNMAQLLGKPYVVTLTHNKNKEGTRTYVNMYNDEGEWTIQPPIYEDPLDGTVKVIPVPEVTLPYQLLLWDNPTKEQWDSLFIDGSYTKKVKGEDGKEVEKEFTKNWLQQSIMRDAIDFEDSPLHDLLSGLGGLTLDGEVETGPADEQAGALDAVLEGTGTDSPAADAPSTPQATQPATKPADPEPAKKPEPAAEKPKSAADVLGALGL